VGEPLKFAPRVAQGDLCGSVWRHPGSRSTDARKSGYSLGTSVKKRNCSPDPYWERNAMEKAKGFLTLLLIVVVTALAAYLYFRLAPGAGRLG